LTVGGPAALFAQAASNVPQMVDSYCAECHNGVTRSASRTLLEPLDFARISENREQWARAYRHLQAGTMPPVGSARPDRATSDAALASIEQGLSQGEAKSAAPTSQEIGTRLAKMLWGTDPDAALLKDANAGRLANPATLQRQVKRMLADERAQAFVSNFFFPWLQLDQLSKSDPDKQFFPDYDVSLRDSLAKETEMFLLSQLRDDRDPLDLWTAQYTFLNEQVAKHYGITGVSGSQFRRVALTQPERDGLLGQGSIMMATARLQPGNQGFTSPAARALWIERHFLGASTPLPAPNARPVQPGLPITPQTRVLPAEPCLNCHRNFFPLGYAMENFDALGRWRTQDQGGPVDASGWLVDGTKFNGVVELRKALLQRPTAFETTITERLLAYSENGSATTTADTLVDARKILDGIDKPHWNAIIAAVASH
jgi:hypothetical protein